MSPEILLAGMSGLLAVSAFWLFRRNKILDGELCALRALAEAQAERLSVQQAAQETLQKSFDQALSRLDLQGLQEQALASSTCGVVITDMQRPGQPVIYVNQAFERITGYASAEIVGHNCGILQQGCSEDQSWVLEDIRRIIQTGSAGKVTIQNVRKSGEPFWNELQLAPIKDRNGVVTHYIGVQNDISIYVENMRAMVDSEQRLALTIDALHEGVWDWDMTTNGLITSPSWAKVLGLEPESYMSPHTLDSLTDCLPPEWYKPYFRAVQAHVEGDTPDLDLEHQMLRPDGRLIWVNSHGKVVERAPDGQALRMVGSIVDVTERVEASERIIGLMSQLDVILTLTPDGIAHFDENGRISFINFAFECLTGIKAGDISGVGQEAFVEMLSQQADPAHRFPELLATASQHSGDERQLIYMAKPRASVLQVSWHSHSAGNSVVVYLRDVTHETEVDRMKSEFLSTAAHELRTPMASIMGFSELLMMREFAPEKMRDMLSTIHRQAKRLTVLINELLDLARIEARAGKDFIIDRHALAPLIQDAVNSFNPEGDRRRIKLLFPENLPDVWLDPAKFQQAVINLLSNAYKYSPEGGDVEVFVEERMLDGVPALGVGVRDHGMGMSKEQCERVFERFYRADPSGNIPGTGLGMSLVKEVMEGLGGGVSLSSEPGVGTTVILWLKTGTQDSPKLVLSEVSNHRPYGELTLWDAAGG